MHITLLAVFFGSSRMVVSMCCAGILLFLIGLWTAKSDIARAYRLDKFVAATNLCFAIPLAVFGALHLANVAFVLPAVPDYMPWRLFWAYFVGVALVAASLSIATKIQAFWSGLLFGIMMFLFFLMSDLPRVLANPTDRFGWTLAIRELSFAAGGWLLAASAMRGLHRSKLTTVGRIILGVAAIFYGVEHFLHPLHCPGVPLEKIMPAYIPGRPLIGVATGAILVVAGAFILLNKNTRAAATYLGSWIVLLVVFVYGPIMIVQLLDPGIGAKVEGINYFADTLLFAAAILALAAASPHESEQPKAA
ncbi:MAG TPA: hypothetical protein VMF56_06225 [Acidobacteriaceae bacterium]|nr:hypothetical protein [Acidobacteriaceae bacterium]